MRRLVTVILAAILVCACTDTRRQATLDRAARLMDTRPDSSLLLLDSLLTASQRSSSADRLSDWPRRDRMRWLLLRTNAENKLDTVFRTDTLFRPVVDWYDRHGTPNERMLAHYLLGRIYSDMGEAPEALQAFHDAADCADTTATDCDFRTLNRVYSQEAWLFNSQFMPERELQSLLRASHYALLAKDTLSHLIYLSKLTDAFQLMGKPDSVISNTKTVYRKFSENGYPEHAARGLVPLIYAELERAQFTEAKKNMDVYESSSGYWHDGEMEKGKELYYYFKGLYYLGINNTDSAETFFRKLQSTSRTHNDIHAAYEGLRRLYRNRNMKDSLAKYAELSASSNDSIFLETNVRTLEQMQAMYDYNRQQALADKMSLKAERSERTVFMLTSVFLVSILIAYVLAARYRRYKNDKYESMKRKLELVIASHEKAQQELSSLLDRNNADHQQQIEKKQTEIASLTDEISCLSKQLSREHRAKRDTQMLESVAYIRFRTCADTPEQNVTSKDWLALRAMMNRDYPEFYAALVIDGRLKPEEFDTCILFRLHFKPSEIAWLTHYQLSSVSTQRRRISKKLLGHECSTDEFCDFLMKI